MDLSFDPLITYVPFGICTDHPSLAKEKLSSKPMPHKVEKSNEVEYATDIVADGPLTCLAEVHSSLKSENSISCKREKCNFEGTNDFDPSDTLNSNSHQDIHYDALTVSVGKDIGCCKETASLVEENFVDEINTHSSSLQQRTSDLKERILRLVEYLLSDEYLKSKNSVLKVMRNGWVNIRFLASFKKMKRLTQDYAFIADVLRKSEKLRVNKEGTKVSRRNPFSLDKALEDEVRTIITASLPDDIAQATLVNTFSEYGEIEYVKVIQPRKYVQVSGKEKKIILKPKSPFAFIRFRDLESAISVCEDQVGQEDWRADVQVELQSGLTPEEARTRLQYLHNSMKCLSEEPDIQPSKSGKEANNSPVMNGATSKDLTKQHKEKDLNRNRRRTSSKKKQGQYNKKTGTEKEGSKYQEKWKHFGNKNRTRSHTGQSKLSSDSNNWRCKPGDSGQENSNVPHNQRGVKGKNRNARSTEHKGNSVLSRGEGSRFSVASPITIKTKTSDCNVVGASIAIHHRNGKLLQAKGPDGSRGFGRGRGQSRRPTPPF